MNIHKKYEYLTYALNCSKRYANRNFIEYPLNKRKVKCPICGIETTLNGCTAHSKLHSQIYKEKIKIIKEFIFPEKEIKECINCGKQLSYIDQVGRVNPTEISTCSFGCAQSAHAWVKRYEKYLTKCVICGKQMISKNLTCSDECYKKLFSSYSKNWHKNLKENDPESYKRYCNKIKMASIQTKKGNYYPAWNKGITGSQFLSYYEKPDGTNSLIEGIKKNQKWFKKTKPQILFQNMLQQLQFQFKYNIFVNNRQFDFLIKIGQKRLVVEVDGDWWHKSIRRCYDEDQRKMARLKDKLKQNIIKKHRKGWQIVRVWQIDIYEQLKIIKNMFKKLKEGIQYEKTICEIKQYYNQKS